MEKVFIYIVYQRVAKKPRMFLKRIEINKIQKKSEATF